MLTRNTLLIAATLAFAGCAANQPQSTLGSAQLSPRARQLPQRDLQEIIHTVGGKNIIAIGQACADRPTMEFNVIASYTENARWLYRLRKTNGKWRIFSQGPLSFAFTNVWTSC